MFAVGEIVVSFVPARALWEQCLLGGNKNMKISNAQTFRTFIEVLFASLQRCFIAHFNDNDESRKELILLSP